MLTRSEVAKFNYELIDYEITEQNLTLDDLRYLLKANLISPFSMVRRVREVDAFPILAHPDFPEDLLKSKGGVKSKNCARFEKHLLRIHSARKKANSAKTASKAPLSAQLIDRRRPLPTVIMRHLDKVMLGALLSREKKTLNVVTPTLDLKLGQVLELEVLSSYKKEKFHGKVNSYKERVDRRKVNRTFYTYEILVLAIL